jgi:hypothetical protein
MALLLGNRALCNHGFRLPLSYGFRSFSTDTLGNEVSSAIEWYYRQNYYSKAAALYKRYSNSQLKPNIHNLIRNKLISSTKHAKYLDNAQLSARELDSLLQSSAVEGNIELFSCCVTQLHSLDNSFLEDNRIYWQLQQHYIFAHIIVEMKKLHAYNGGKGPELLNFPNLKFTPAELAAGTFLNRAIINMSDRVNYFTPIKFTEARSADKLSTALSNLSDIVAWPQYFLNVRAQAIKQIENSPIQSESAAATLNLRVFARKTPETVNNYSLIVAELMYTVEEIFKRPIRPVKLLTANLNLLLVALASRSAVENNEELVSAAQFVWGVFTETACIPATASLNTVLFTFLTQIYYSALNRTDKVALSYFSSMICWFSAAKSVSMVYSKYPLSQHIMRNLRREGSTNSPHFLAILAENGLNPAEIKREVLEIVPNPDTVQLMLAAQQYLHARNIDCSSILSAHSARSLLSQLKLFDHAAPAFPKSNISLVGNIVAPSYALFYAWRDKIKEKSNMNGLIQEFDRGKQQHPMEFVAKSGEKLYLALNQAVSEGKGAEGVHRTFWDFMKYQRIGRQTLEHYKILLHNLILCENMSIVVLIQVFYALFEQKIALDYTIRDAFLQFYLCQPHNPRSAIYNEARAMLDDTYLTSDGSELLNPAQQRQFLALLARMNEVSLFSKPVESIAHIKLPTAAKEFHNINSGGEFNYPIPPFITNSLQKIPTIQLNT